MGSDEQMSSIVFLTGQYKIKGRIGLMSGVRLADYMNETKDFIPVIEAEVFDRESGEKIYTKSLVNVRRRSIEVVVLEDESTWLDALNRLGKRKASPKVYLDTSSQHAGI